MTIATKDKNRLIKNLASYSNKLKQHLTPLFTSTKINCFQFARFTQDNYWQAVCTHQPILENIIDREYFVAHFSEDDFTKYQDGYFFMQELPANSKEKFHYRELAEVHRIGNLFMIVQKSNTYCDFFIFGADITLNMTNFYINNSAMLSKIASLIRTRICKDVNLLSSTNQVYVPKKRVLRNPLSESEDQDILAAFHGYFVNEPPCKNTMRLTPREKECLQFLLGGFNAKKIAQSLQVSSRTIETHIENLKQKFGVRKKKEILNFYRELY